MSKEIKIPWDEVEELIKKTYGIKEINYKGVWKDEDCDPLFIYITGKLETTEERRKKVKSEEEWEDYLSEIYKE